jgi:hypothetical protein
MYLRVTGRRNRDGSTVAYYALAENEWNAKAKRSEVRVVHSFGRADQLDKAALRRLVASINRVIDADATDTLPTRGKTVVPEIDIETVFELGIVLAVRGLWQELGIGEAIRTRMARAGLTAPHEMALFAMATHRLDDPRRNLPARHGGCPTSPGCRRPVSSRSISSIAPSTSSPSGLKRSNATCSCAAPTCFVSTST